MGVSKKKSTPNFPKNEHFLVPDPHTYVCVSEGKKCSFFGKLGVLCFPWKTRFKIRLFGLLPTKYSKLSVTLSNIGLQSKQNLNFIVRFLLVLYQFVYSINLKSWHFRTHWKSSPGLDKFNSSRLIRYTKNRCTKPKFAASQETTGSITFVLY